MWVWVVWFSVGVALEAVGAFTDAPTLSEGVQAAWAVDWVRPVFAVAWVVLTGHWFLGWWD